MLTPSLVIVGAPHFFSSTTLRPFGPSVTFTASASWFLPRSRPRRASPSNAILLAIRRCPPGQSCVRNPHRRSGLERPRRPVPEPGPHRPDHWHSDGPSANHLFSTLTLRVQG